ncbi:Phosphoinositide 5-phosphatase [Aphelenchoides bicaudatus]|nr:Phosphoinositide 5-phosphatase [Aphelenchoides bicaudatus]
MSLRGYHVHSSRLTDGTFSLLVEQTNSSRFLVIQSGAILEHNTESGEQLKRTYSKCADGYGLLGIIRLSSDEAYLILVNGVFSVGKLHECDVYKIINVQFIPLQYEISEFLDPRIVELQRLLTAGIFYFACSPNGQITFDLTLSAQKRHSKHVTDNSFFWNRSLCFPFEKYNVDINNWISKTMCGSVLVRTIYVAHLTARVAILSRLSCERVGTRFNVRGANDDGSVANFVETEQLVLFEEHESSFVQIRGSVPLFWEQPGFQVGSHKVRLKPVEVSMPAFERHYSRLRQTYGNISTVNLLGSKEGEKLLSTAFQSAFKTSSHHDLPFIAFDYHAQMKSSKTSVQNLMRQLDQFLSANQFFAISGEKLLNVQKGCIRTNCLDCLDRTGCVQTLIGLKILVAQLQELGVDRIKSQISSRFIETFKDLWQKNGDQCSVIYTGTGALEGKSKLRDASRSLARTIQNNLMDTAKQESFDLFLLGQTYGNAAFDRATNILQPNVMRECPQIVEELVTRRTEFINRSKLSIFAGTWNVNGGKNVYNVAFRHEQSLGAWLFPELLNRTPYDVVAIGLEEIVDLNAGNMVKASTSNQRIWRDGIKKVLEDQYEGRESYVVLACEQLVGVCIIVYVRLELLSRMRELGISDVKTGLGGATGNKGSIAIRLTIDSTSFCFVCSHFAAGQNEIAARNDDFNTAWRKLRFQAGRQIDSHDVIIWFGDFNYRISLSGDEVKNAVRNGDFANLNNYDQLNQQRAIGNAFKGFREGPLNFAPTYKYDTFSDDYDTSEKCRAPAWTDRVLWQDTPELPVILTHYGRSELKTSDHRPVTALFMASVSKIDREKCLNVIEDIVASMGPPDCTVLCQIDKFDPFPTDFVASIFDKLRELMLTPVLTKCEGPYLWLVMNSGTDAIAALSMDGVHLQNCTVSVKLRTETWVEDFMEHLKSLLETETTVNEQALNSLAALNLNIDDDDEEWVNVRGGDM